MLQRLGSKFESEACMTIARELVALGLWGRGNITTGDMEADGDKYTRARWVQKLCEQVSPFLPQRNSAMSTVLIFY